MDEKHQAVLKHTTVMIEGGKPLEEVRGYLDAVTNDKAFIARLMSDLEFDQEKTKFSREKNPSAIKPFNWILALVFFICAIAVHLIFHANGAIGTLPLLLFVAGVYILFAKYKKN